MAKKVAILTGGGDCPGLNAVIRAATLKLTRAGYEMVGVARRLARAAGQRLHAA